MPFLHPPRISVCGHKLSQIPDMIGQSGFHRRGHTQRSVRPAEIIERKPQRVCIFQIRPFLAESVGEPRHAAHPHPDREILSLDVRCANPLVIWHSDLGHDDDFNNFRWRVSLFAVACCRIDLLIENYEKVNGEIKVKIELPPGIP